MRQHRHPPATVPDKDQAHKLDLANAVEDMHDDVARVEALAAAAAAALERLPRAATAEGRYAARALYHLVSMTAEEASEALQRSDQALERLAVQLQERK